MKIRQAYWHNPENEPMGMDRYKYCPICGESLVQKLIDKRSRQTCPHCGFIHFMNPAPTVSLLIVDDGKFLLGKRSQHPARDCWATPSGYIEFNEDFLTTAIRETKEETNLDIEILEILDVTDSFFSPDQHYLNVYLLARVIGGELQAGDDVQEAAWFPLNDALPEMAFQEDIDLIEDYRKRNG